MHAIYGIKYTICHMSLYAIMNLHLTLKKIVTTANIKAVKL